jgi:hypothetical protein
VQLDTPNGRSLAKKRYWQQVKAGLKPPPRLGGCMAPDYHRSVASHRKGLKFCNDCCGETKHRLEECCAKLTDVEREERRQQVQVKRMDELLAMTRSELISFLEKQYPESIDDLKKELASEEVIQKRIVEGKLRSYDRPITRPVVQRVRSGKGQNNRDRIQADSITYDR